MALAESNTNIMRTADLERTLRSKKGWQSLVKRGVHTLRKPQYQVCFVDSGIANSEEMEQLKTIDRLSSQFGKQGQWTSKTFSSSPIGCAMTFEAG
ncbi:hypothetical protein C2845_PM11G11910 [Panicum miliaceum]|uniref:Uncharacterized protein n=1 Tax=Panicum miliaceum TaxID=4540 RepID=A0A3L6RYB1_PANMI|nr:hypothetical protein C2845_PM11G11910 [Panicum miliaceum]